MTRDSTPLFSPKIKTVPLPQLLPRVQEKACAGKVRTLRIDSCCGDSQSSLDAGSRNASLNAGRSSRLGPCLIALRLWHLSSLDAPTVAVVWSLGFAWAAGVRLPPAIPILRALVVWAVYITDRLLDARAALGIARRELPLDRRLRERHYFHWRYRWIFLTLAAVSAGAALWMAFEWMPRAAREPDSVLAAASLAYLARVHTGHRLRPFLSRFMSKELLVGILFAGGCALPAAGMLWAMPHASPERLVGPAAFFAGLAWLNCHAIDRWESCPDPSGRSLIFPSAISIGAAGVAIFLSAAFPHAAQLVAAGGVSAWLLALLDRRRGRICPVELRAAADLVLLTPAVLIPLECLLR